MKIKRNKKANSCLHFNHTQHLLKCKRSQGVMGMPFSVIFSILLIVFIIVIATIVIKAFLDYQSCSQIGLFISDFRTEVNNAWNSQSASYTFTSTMPRGIDYVCFVNMTRNIKDSDPDWVPIFEDVKWTGVGDDVNMILYPYKKACKLGFIEVRHIRLPERNPFCIEPRDGKINIKIEKTFEDPLVNIIE